MAIVGFVGNAAAIESQLREENQKYYDKLQSSYQGAVKDVEDYYSPFYQSIGLNAEKSLAANTRSYQQQLVSAYDKFLDNKSSVDRSNLGTGYRNLLYEENKDILNNAFESYKQQYLSQKQSIESSADENINKILTSQQSDISTLTEDYLSSVSDLNEEIGNYAQNFVNYTDAHYGYLSWLYKKNKDAFTNPMLARFLNEDGELVGTSQISAGIYDDKGNLTEYGKDFFNFIENAKYGGYTFQDYLAENNSKLFEWGVSGGAERFQESIGFNGTYKPTQYSLTEDQFNTTYNTQSTAYNDMIGSRDAALDDDDKVKSYMDNLKSNVESLVSFAKAAGVYDQVKDLADNLLKDVDSYSESNEHEWAVTNSFADYEELYNAVMGARGKGSVSNAGDRVANYDLVDEQITDLKTKGLTGDEYIAEANRILKNYGTFEFDDSKPEQVGGNSHDRRGFSIDYETSNAGSENITVGYNPSDEINGNGFISLKHWSKPKTYSGGGSVAYDMEIGRIGNKPVIKVNGKYYYAQAEYDTADNRAFMLYLSSFKEKDKNEKWQSFTNDIWSKRTKRSNE